ncbi:nascent polypeptide-associated complex subunit alpha, muscle-specific form [Cyclospora cayetanensis]|uniref:Nascent polypeptide-associated complex subunit alpha, muscle-specific form n=1 Tax=Cyclospora cayetanensis TaxID=88456 RepID=A0A6P6S1B6_9EIME|nr:nascent polypeptide-associated complex subunit alpha, muscle-specific form [Cyclospora cayetanensis]
MEKKLPVPKPPVSKAVVIVGKGPPPPGGPPGGGIPGAKIVLQGNGPPPGKAALTKPPAAPLPGGAPKPAPPGAVVKSAASSVAASAMASAKPTISKPDVPQPALKAAQKELPKAPGVPAGTKPLGSPPKSPLLPKTPLSESKSPLSKSPEDAKKPSLPGNGAPKPPATSQPPKLPASAAKGPPGESKAPTSKIVPDAGSPIAVKGLPGAPKPAAAAKESSGPTPLPVPGASLKPAAGAGKPASPPKQEASGPAGAPSAPPGADKSASPAPPVKKASVASAGQAPGVGPEASKPAAPKQSLESVDELGRLRGVGDLAPKSELAHDLLGNSIPVFDKQGNWVAYATGPASPLHHEDPGRRSRRLADRRPEMRDAMKGPVERGLDAGALGGVSVPGGIPGYFMSVPPWPVPTPMPMDVARCWGTHPQWMNFPDAQISPYAAYPPQAVRPPHPMMYGQPYAYEEGSQGPSTQQGTLPGNYWPGYPLQSETPEPPKAVKKEGVRTRGYVMARGDEELGKTKWSAVERHINNIRGGYGEAFRPPEESQIPPKTPSMRAVRKHSGTRDEIYSGFRPYYVRDKKPYVDEVIPRSGEPKEASSAYPVFPKKNQLMLRPKERTWDRWGTTGLTAPRKRTYQSLSELASCFSNLEAEDQDDVISLLLLCRKLEQQVEKQHVVIDMLEHDLSEAQKVLKFPPEWRSLEGLDFAGMVPSDTPFQATAATPLFIKSTSSLPSNVPEDPNANFGVGVPLTGQSKPTPATRTAPATAGGTTPAAKPVGAAKLTPTPGVAAADGPKKPPAGMKPRAPVLGAKKVTFKKA